MQETELQFDIRDILKILPHRYPFLMVDKILSIDVNKGKIIGQKNVSMNEHFFQGHFPSMPVMPGVLIVESIAQTGAVLLFQKGYRNSLALLLTISNAKFRRPVHPGDVLFLHGEGMHFGSRGGKIKGKAFVNDNLVAEVEIGFAITDHPNAGESSSSADTVNIHPTAVIENGAQLGKNIVIEPYAVIKKNVVIENNVVVKSHAYIDGYTTIGEGCVIWPFTSIGTKSQDLKFKGEKTFVKIGKNCDIREHTQINSSAGEGSTVIVGDSCLIMASCHVAHQCTLGEKVILSGGAKLAGHVVVEDKAIIGGMTGIHQFCRVGKNAMVGGMSRVTLDIPPYTLGGGAPYKFGGINSVGLKRSGFSYETRKILNNAFKLMYRSGNSLDVALKKIDEELEKIPEIEHLLNFCKNSKRGLMGFQKNFECAENQSSQEDFENLNGEFIGFEDQLIEH